MRKIFTLNWQSSGRNWLFSDNNNLRENRIFVTNIIPPVHLYRVRIPQLNSYLQYLIQHHCNLISALLFRAEFLLDLLSPLGYYKRLVMLSKQLTMIQTKKKKKPLAYDSQQSLTNTIKMFNLLVDIPT